MMPDNETSIYLISPASIVLESFIPMLNDVLKTGHASVFQLRLKNISDHDYELAAREVVKCCHENKVMCLINDKPEIAAAVDADGVHLGKEDGSYQYARELLGDHKMIGISCYNSVDDAIKAAEDGANYVAFGAFYPTETKENTVVASQETLRWWVENSTTACVAIGGINVGNVNPLVACGADFIAVVSAVWDHLEGPVAGIEALHRTMRE
jgi:thiamine-phosphate pyrophosphorylase